MLVRRFVAVLCLVAMTAVYSRAFKFDIHADITTQALSELIGRLPKAWKTTMFEPGFSAAAMKEITDANVAKDTDDCGDKYNVNVPASPCKLSESETLSALWKVTSTAHGDHFDAEYFQQGSNKIFAARKEIVQSLLDKNFVAARKVLGGALHGIQDFYAHSNWVELQYEKLEDRLGSDPNLNLFSTKFPHVSGSDVPACEAGIKAFLPIREYQHLLPHYFNEMPPDKAAPEDLLTSGYFTLVEDDDSVVKYGKCRHGWEEVIVNQSGINKDDPGRRGFEQAKAYAYAHSINFVLELLGTNPTLRTDPTYTLGLMGHPLVSSTVPDHMRPGDEGFTMNVNGQGFTKNAVALWQGRPLKTTWVTDKVLMADVPKAEITYPGNPVVSVTEPNISDGKEVIGGDLLSNEIPFHVAEPEDCPGKIHPHEHDSAYIDVNANMWNDSGLTVKAGDKLNFEVMNGLVVWRAGGFFTGGAGEAPPQGDSRATPGTVLLWVDPPIPINQVPIGALIGMIPDEHALPPYTEKPPGAKYVPIFNGKPSVPPMPASGRLYLGINDGAFFNNGGCFQVRVTPAK